MRLTLVISSLSAGGAERVLSGMANYWAEKNWSVTVVTLDKEKPFYKLHSTINHRALGLSGVSKSAPEKVLANISRGIILRRAIREASPQIVISFLSETNVLTILATRGLGMPVIVSERVDPYEFSIGGGWQTLRRLTYPLADSVVVQGERSRRYFSRAVQQRSRIIPNPVIAATARSTARSLSQSAEVDPKVLAMGRLVPQKGFDLLIRAFARIAPQHPRWRLEICGEGAMRKELETLIVELGMRERIMLGGTTTDPFDKMHRSELFVLSSRFEGFPNVLCEAMACGMAVVSFNCPSGPGDIIRDGLDGILVPAGNIAELSGAMSRLMADSGERLRLSQRAPDVLDRFGIDRVMGMWESLIRETLTARQTGFARTPGVATPSIPGLANRN